MPPHVPLSTTRPFYKQALLAKNPVAFCKDVADHYGDFVHVRGLLDFYLVNHEDLLGTMLVNKGGRLQRIHPENPIYQRIGNVGRSGLATSAEEHWRKQRRLLAPLFSAANIRGFAQSMLDAATRWSERWQHCAHSGQALDLKRETNDLALEVNTRCLFDTDVREDYEKLDRWFAAMKQYLEAFPFPVVSEWWFPSPLNLRTRHAIRAFDRYALALIEDRRNRAAQDGGRDLISRMIGATDPETGRGMSDHEISHEMLTFLIAGYESTSSALLWTLYHLATKPEIEAKLHAELDRVVGARAVSPEDLPQLVYTRRVIDEVMRITPSVWFMSRSTVNGESLGGNPLPAGSHLLASIPTVHHNPNYWPDPDRFDPDRFLPEAVAQRPANVYLPFGRGPHACIGSHFSLQELVATVAVLCSQFRVRLEGPPIDTTDVRAGLSVYPRQRLRVQVQTRRRVLDACA